MIKIQLIAILFIFFFCDLKDVTILDGNGSVLIPSSFELMSKEMLAHKYRLTSNMPNEVYTDEKAEINVIFDHTLDRVSTDQLGIVKENLVDQFHQATTIDLLSHYDHSINGRDFFVIEFISQAVDTQVYNLMFGTSYHGRLLMGTFNCTIAHREKWEPVGNEVLNSIKLK